MSESDIEVAVKLDCRGLHCPLPILRAKKELDSLTTGEVLEIVATDRGSVADFAAFCDRTGHRLVDQSAGGGEFVFFVEKA